MLGFIGGLRGLLSGLAGASVMLVALSAYDRLWDDPAVARQARAAFVERAEKLEAAAIAAEARRQREAVERAAEEFNHKLIVQEALHATRIEEREQRISDYEKQMDADGRSDRLTRPDIDFLLKP